MVNYRTMAVASFLASVNGLPLNINLGAYSPALVVRDGEISFGGEQDVTNLMNALEGAAVNTAAANNAATNGAAENVQALVTTTSDPTPIKGPVSSQGRGTAVTIAATTTAAATPAAVDTGLQEQAQKTSALQGLGKEIAPRERSGQSEIKRDLQGFDRALTYAEAALTKGPLIQLGTGEGGAGVGIIVDNRPDASNGASEGAAKRDGISQPSRPIKVTRMYVKRVTPAAIEDSSDFNTRSVQSLATLDLPALPKRDSPSAIDAINLNIPANKEITMTFIETTDSEDEAQEIITPE